ncbi:MAG: acyl-CoA thioesterase [Cyanobacteria bacterium]|nr:acyl-CoA thioesterase [Cyanobacteriota bacterium]MDW8200871.1 thioesterase family protein [Cyanobacteriota bacterium SKYGB_h_bin112]
MAFTYDRTIRFQDTDAAGVVFFANILAICHEAYEASLAASSVDLKSFFSGRELAVPITHTRADFLRPLFCGDRITIQLTPQQTSDTDFEVQYQLVSSERPDKLVSSVFTRHVCVQVATRTRTHLPATILQWLEQWK